MTDRLRPGATIGILGGGQLGRMLSVAAAASASARHIFEPGADPPAADVAHAVTTRPMTMRRPSPPSPPRSMSSPMNSRTSPPPPSTCWRRPGRSAPTAGRWRSARTGSPKRTFLDRLGLTTAPYAAVTTAGRPRRGHRAHRLPAILKTTRLGYDGKGQARIKSPADAPAAWPACRGRPRVLEGFIPFTMRSRSSPPAAWTARSPAYDPGENVHRDGILHTTTVPARLTPGQRSDAILLAARILNALDYVGVMGVELFVTPEGLIVNEIAPRVHNSGHWTQNGCAVDQFEQHIRAVAGWPLGDGGAPCRCGDGKPDRRRRRPRARPDRPRTQRRAAPLRQGRGPARAARWGM